MERAAADAEKGDAQARDWLAVYLVGKAESAAPALSQAQKHERNVEDEEAWDEFFQPLARVLGK